MVSTVLALVPKPVAGSPHPWIGRIAIFELITGTRVQGKILQVTEEWIDTDNGAVQVKHIVHAKWVSAEEAAIIRADSPYGDPNRRLR